MSAQQNYNTYLGQLKRYYQQSLMNSEYIATFNEAKRLGSVSWNVGRDKSPRFLRKSVQILRFSLLLLFKKRCGENEIIYRERTDYVLRRFYCFPVVVNTSIFISVFD